MAATSNASRIAILFAVAAILVGGLAVWALVNVLGQATVQSSQATRPVETVSVVVAKRRLYQGVQITNEDLDVIEIPAEVLPIIEDKENAGEVTTADVFSSRERVVGQVPRERILANEVIRPERLADGNAGVGLNAVIPRGMRAISLGLTGADAVAGFLEPGNYVDVLVTMADELGRPRTETILQAVFVLGVDSRAQNESEESVAERGKVPSVTFLVTPKQAEDIAYASQLGDISLSLRNVQDVNYASVAGKTMADLTDRLRPTVKEPVKVISRPKPVVAAPKEPEGPIIIRGTSRSRGSNN